MNAPRFPRSPDIHKGPFEDGNNPFADELPSRGASEKAGENVYGARVLDDVRPDRTGVYEAVLPNRARSVVILGAIGSVLSSISCVLALLTISSPDWVEGMFYILPISLTSEAFTIPAWIMARGDLGAIRAGAMSPLGRRGTRMAYWLGCLGTVVGVMPVLGGIAALIVSL